jgi:hypothetical protein
VIGGVCLCAAAAAPQGEGVIMRAAKRTLQFHDFVLFGNSYQL